MVGEVPEVTVSDALGMFDYLAEELESGDKRAALEELRTLDIIPASESVRFQRQLGKISHRVRGGAKATGVIRKPKQLGPAGPPSLIFFYGKDDGYSNYMMPLVQKMEEQFGIEVRRFEVWRGPQKAQELLSKMDRQRCGGVPFFYNKDTKLSICGATTEANLRQWALGKPCEPILPPPNVEKLAGGMQQDTEMVKRLKQAGGLLQKRKAEMMEKQRQKDEEKAAKKKAAEEEKQK
jgi:hypothetical protein